MISCLRPLFFVDGREERKAVQEGGHWPSHERGRRKAEFKKEHESALKN